ncbi:glycosyltransferase family 9 protein [Acidocella sp.]|uniref:glycosyltransferase family 9 protein n=1 Tax=Acidocella sp. TaxID=50710 RepID=UPI00262A2DA5|nr:glycosyltransferase family 9 protein [Acidocella sp.]
MRILFISSSRIGDAVISCGILEQLRRQHPAARFTIACGSPSEGVFSRFPQLEKLIVFDKQRFDLHWLTLWRQIVPHIWDLVVDVRGSGISLLLAAKRRKIMKGGRRPGRRYAQLGAAMGYEPAPLPVAWTSAADEAKAARLLGDGPVIALGPTANWDGKIWPPERFVALFHALAARLPGARAAIFGGPGADEARRAAPVLAALPDAINLVGRLTLPEAAACLRRGTIYIGNDSGLMHLAAAAGAPTLGLFGRSKASEYAPAGARVGIAVAPGPEGEAAMEDLTLERVVSAAYQLLGVDA